MASGIATSTETDILGSVADAESVSLSLGLEAGVGVGSGSCTVVIGLPLISPSDCHRRCSRESIGRMWRRRRGGGAGAGGLSRDGRSPANGGRCTVVATGCCGVDNAFYSMAQ